MGKKKSIDEKIADALDIDLTTENVEIVSKESDDVEIEEVSEREADMGSDYDLVRGNLKDIIKTGQGAIDGILNVASEGESPRAYEVVSQLIKTVADANKDLMDLHKKVKDLEKDDSTKQSAGRITNNAIYVGSTKDLQKLVKDSRNQAETIDADFNVIEGDINGDERE
tara:strand:- start:9864 stop:10370 length:507 start_codon:yes stop_codon:yes gene_type:complete